MRALSTMRSAEIGEPERADVRAARLERVRAALDASDVARREPLGDVLHALGRVLEEDVDQLDEQPGSSSPPSSRRPWMTAGSMGVSGCMRGS
jgi:hypothetical protein